MSTPWHAPDGASGPPVAPNVPPTGPDYGEAPSPLATPRLPQYGEMAPPGYVSPVPQPMPQPEPQQREAPVYFATPPVVRRPRTADVAITCVLLGLGLFGMIAGLAAGAQLPLALADEYRKYGLTPSSSLDVGAVSVLIAVSHVVLYIIAVCVSIPLMVKRRVSFYVPLIAGVIAALIFWVGLIALIASDPSLMHAMSGGTS
jgi:Family of unknown function (DUF6264)